MKTSMVYIILYTLARHHNKYVACSVVHHAMLSCKIDYKGGTRCPTHFQL